MEPDPRGDRSRTVTPQTLPFVRHPPSQPGRVHLGDPSPSQTTRWVQKGRPSKAGAREGLLAGPTPVRGSTQACICFRTRGSGRPHRASGTTETPVPLDRRGSHWRWCTPACGRSRPPPTPGGRICFQPIRCGAVAAIPERGRVGAGPLYEAGSGHHEAQG